MKYALTVSIVCMAALVGCSQDEGSAMMESKDNSSPICSTAQLAGGWSETDVSPLVQEALDLVLSRMNTAAKLERILSVRSQVVNGTNYAIEFQMDNGEVWTTIVYRSLKGALSITQPAQQGRLCQ